MLDYNSPTRAAFVHTCSYSQATAGGQTGKLTECQTESVGKWNWMAVREFFNDSGETLLLSTCLKID